MDLVVDRKEQLAEGVVRLTLRHPGGERLPPWQPGAHIDLVLEPGLVRQYSLCGDPVDPFAFTVAVLREREGRGGSAFVHDRLAEGDAVRVEGPRNRFPLVEATRYLFIAGGIGITPLLPMLAAVREADWRLVYGGRTRASMAYWKDLCREYGDRVTVCPQDETGLLDLDTLLADPGAVVYCCGPEALLAAVEERCATWPPGSLHVERFTARPRPQPGAPGPDGSDSVAGTDRRAGSGWADGADTSFEIELAGSGRVLTVPAGRSILDVVSEAGVPVLFSCREGTCGTCETGVLGGMPEHRDSLLSEQERAAGDVMMICVSRARTPRLRLEL